MPSPQPALLLTWAGAPILGFDHSLGPCFAQKSSHSPVVRWNTEPHTASNASVYITTSWTGDTDTHPTESTAESGPVGLPNAAKET